MESYPSVITSHTNPKIKKARSLHQKKFRERQRAFLVEGPRAITELLKSSWEIDALFFDPQQVERSACTDARTESEALLDKILSVASRQAESRPRSVDLQPVASEVLSSLSQAEHHQGCVAVARIPTADLRQLHPGTKSFVLLLDGISDPGNVGTMIRTGDAFGAEAVLLTENCADPFNPKTVRSTAGSLFHLPVCQSDGASILARLRLEKYQLVGAASGGSTDLLTWSPAARTAVVFGHETRGISPLIECQLDGVVAIPMSGRTESLNVAAACAVISWEVFRRQAT